MASPLFTERLASASARHPWRTIGAWFVILIVAFGSLSQLNLTSDDHVYVQLESQKADDLRDAGFRPTNPGPPGSQPDRGADEFVLLRSADRTVDSSEFRAVAQRLIGDLRAVPTVAEVTSFYDAGDARLVSPDRHTLLIPTVLRGGDPQDLVVPVQDVVHGYDHRDGFEAVSGGEGSVDKYFDDTVSKDLSRVEIVGLPMALIILIVVFGALVAAGLPIAMAVGAIITTIGIVAWLSQMTELSIYVLNMVLLIGLAVGIDYSLLIVKRYREERASGLDRDAAIARTGATACHAVLFSGAAVLVALCGLLIVPHSLFRSLGTGAIVVVLVAVAAALTVLPAILHLLGDKVDAGRLRIPGRRARPAGEFGAFWSRTSAFVMRHAWLSVIVSVALLVGLSLPYFSLKLGESGVASLPHGSEPYRAFTLLDTEFSAGVLSPAEVVISSPDVRSSAVQGAMQKLRSDLSADAMFRLPDDDEINDRGDVTVINLLINGDQQSDEAQSALKRLRNQYIPQSFTGTDANVYVGGDAAEVADFSGLINRYTPAVFAFVLGISFIILLLVFRSIVVPAKALIMNLLSVGAAYGLMVLVFQHGVAASIFGFRQVDRLDSWVPLFMFAILFGLSMDYHVFLLSRIRERFIETQDNFESVGYGVRSTAGMITGAALIMVAVFTAFAMGDLVMFQQMGFGLAVAVILDATLVRIVLVPASMALLGDLNWFLPRWLGWLPHLQVERHASAPLASGADSSG